MTDTELLESFENQTLLLDQWTHRAHVRVAYGYLSGNSFEEALRKLRAVFPTADAESFCETHPQLMAKTALRFFYTLERRMHRLAKTEFVEPDLIPLPHFREEQCPVE